MHRTQRRPRTVSLLALIAVSLCHIPAALAEKPDDLVRRQCDHNQASFNAQQCYSLRAALGRYQENIDEILSQPFALQPFEKYFLGVSYYALSGRTVAQSLRCFWNAQAKQQLETFVDERQSKFRSESSFGNSDEVNYTYIAARILDNMKDVTGCEESAESLVSLGRYAEKSLAASTEALFYGYGTKGVQADAVADTFNNKLEHLLDSTRQLVGQASRMETDFGLYQIDLKVARQNVATIVSHVNQWQPDAFTTVPGAIPGDESYTVAPPMAALLETVKSAGAELETRTKRLDAVDAIVKAVLGNAAATSLDDYNAKRLETLKQGRAIELDLMRAAGRAQEITREKGFAQTKTLSTPDTAGVRKLWDELRATWSKASVCKKQPKRRYCQ